MANAKAVAAMMRCSDSAKLAKRAFSTWQEKSNPAPPEDPVYSRGPIVAGRKIFEPPKKRFHESN